MRLLNTYTLDFEQFQSSNSLPYYAILSHRWSDAETSFKDFHKNRDQNHPGCKKVIDFCAFARAKGMEYVWVDTCCIDKRSSAELSEAINSMFDWYRRARVCYVYLADVGHVVPVPDDLRESGIYFQDVQRTWHRRQDIRKSSWFSRGWTLQELLAPYTVEFCTHDWQIIGTKADEEFVQLLHEVTHIPIPALRDPRQVSEYSVAQKMSWASRRRTTRVEDQAYCLLGLFQVNMALLYGEGSRAFKRLQTEILAQTDDESLFAWTTERYMVPSSLGLLADSPLNFAASGNIVRTYSTMQPPCVNTNKGLSFTPRTSFCHKHLSEEVWIAYLECGVLKDRKQTTSSRLTGMFSRRDVRQCAVALTREQQAVLVSQVEWRENLSASKRLGNSDASLLVAMRAKFQPTFYRVYANSLTREDMTGSLPRGMGKLVLDQPFYLRV